MIRTKSISQWIGWRPTARLHILIWLVTAAFSLWIRAGFPVVALGGAGADDALFIRLARSLIRGEWLGQYDNLTLAKGMFYPLFIAATSFTAIPLKIAEQIVYLAAAAGTAAYVGRRSCKPWLGTVLFVLLAFNPAFWDRELARVIREGIYGSLSLAVVALAVAVCFFQGRPVRRALLGAALGVVTGGFWLTREEGVWILPALAVPVLIATTRAVFGRCEGRTWLYRLAALMGPMALAVGTFVGSISIVATLNGHFYGNAVTTEFKSESFQRAYGALAGIHQDQWHRYVVFPRDARLRAYAVSPAAQELAPFFEGPGGEAWRRIGCEQSWVAREACPEILAGWFMWALRDAVTAAGHTQSARDARRYYQRLADEIDRACDDGRLSCEGSHRATLAPPFRWRYVGDAWKRSGKVATIVFTLGGGNLETPPSQGMPSELATFPELAGPIAPITGPVEQRMAGWVAAKSGMPTLAIQAGLGMTATVQTVSSGADIESAYPGLTAMRFELVSTCQPATCNLIVSVPDMAPVTLPWAKLVQGTVITMPTGKMFLDRVSSFDRRAIIGLRLNMQRWCAAAIYPFYGYGVPVLSALSLVGLVLAAVRRRGPSLAIFALGVASATAIACRIALLAFLDVTSIPSANSLYASPASPFVILFAVLGIHAGVAALWPQQKGGRPS